MLAENSSNSSVVVGHAVPSAVQRSQFFNAPFSICIPFCSPISVFSGAPSSISCVLDHPPLSHPLCQTAQNEAQKLSLRPATRRPANPRTALSAVSTSNILNAIPIACAGCASSTTPRANCESFSPALVAASAKPRPSVNPLILIVILIEILICLPEMAHAPPHAAPTDEISFKRRGVSTD